LIQVASASKLVRLAADTEIASIDNKVNGFIFYSQTVWVSTLGTVLQDPIKSITRKSLLAHENVISSGTLASEGRIVVLARESTISTNRSRSHEWSTSLKEWTAISIRLVTHMREGITLETTRKTAANQHANFNGTVSSNTTRTDVQLIHGKLNARRLRIAAPDTGISHAWKGNQSCQTQ
jgi:hypothetical protein